MNKFMKTLALSTMIIFSATTYAELPSWGMTENQYKQADFSKKMNEIGAQANKNNWLLKVTAPNDWHRTIKDALTKTGERNVQFTFKDSLYQSIAISAVVGAKIANITPSTTSNTTTQKQVVIERPQVDNTVEAPDFGDTDFQNNNNELLENINAMELTVPTAQSTSNSAAQTVTEVKSVSQADSEPEAAADIVSNVVEQTPAVTPTPEVNNKSVVESTEVDVDDIKESIRKRHARSKRVDKQISYNNITSKDELFIQDQVVLVKRFVNQGLVLYYWMQESYDPTVHKFIERGSGKYEKDPAAINGESDAVAKEKDVPVQATNLDFMAVDTERSDQDKLRTDHIRNKRVEYSISVNQLQADDVLYIQNKTVLVERPITRSRSSYFWLVGETNITKNVERKADNIFVIK